MIMDDRHGTIRASTISPHHLVTSAKFDVGERKNGIESELVARFVDRLIVPNAPSA